MAIVKKPVAKKIEEVKKEVVVQKPTEKAQKPAKNVSAPVIPKEEKKPPKTKAQAQKPVSTPELVAEKFPATVKTAKSEFKKVTDFAEGNYVFMDEGNEKPTVFRIVYTAGKNYVVDITSKGEMAETVLELTKDDISKMEADGCEFAVYQKVK